MTQQQLAEFRHQMVCLKRSIDPHRTDERRYEILRTDFDPFWSAMVELLETAEKAL